MVELADIFRDYGPAYRDKYGARMLPSHLAAMRAIEQCRTEVLGGHLYYCAHCDETWYSYHSCRNRHCPKHVLSLPKDANRMPLNSGWNGSRNCSCLCPTSW